MRTQCQKCKHVFIVERQTVDYKFSCPYCGKHLIIPKRGPSSLSRDEEPEGTILMTVCLTCGHPISPQAEACPNCGEPHKKSVWEMLSNVHIGSLIAFAMIVFFTFVSVTQCHTIKDLLYVWPPVLGLIILLKD